MHVCMCACGCVLYLPRRTQELPEGGFHKLVLVHATTLLLSGLALHFTISHPAQERFLLRRSPALSDPKSSSPPCPCFLIWKVRMLGYMKGKEPLGATIAHLHDVQTLLLPEYLGDWEQGLEGSRAHSPTVGTEL